MTLARWERAILHVDMDAFYVAVELLDQPELRGRPVLVGGTGRRGVVAAASYEARAHGVRAAMPGAQARRLCPQAIFLPGRHERYGEVSREVMALFRRFTPLVEPLSLDEAFLDISGAQRSAGSPAALGATIRQHVADEVGLTCSVGVAPTKFLAKLASEAAKPRPSPLGPIPGIGVKVVEPGHELAFLHPLPLRALWGVGPATLARLERLGIATVGELAELPESAVVGVLGAAAGRHLAALSRGVDDRAVEPERAVKSVGHEETFAYDLRERDAIDRELVRLADAVAARLRRHGLTGRTMTLKVRDGEFHTVTRSYTDRQSGGFDSAPPLRDAARRLFEGVGIGTGVRLLGISVSGLGPAGPRQLSLDGLFGRSFEAAAPDGAPASAPSRPDAWADAEKAMDAIRGRFGEDAIGPAVLASGEGVEVLRRRANPWGPMAEPSDRRPVEDGGAVGAPPGTRPEKSPRSHPRAGQQDRGEG